MCVLACLCTGWRVAHRLLRVWCCHCPESPKPIAFIGRLCLLLLALGVVSAQAQQPFVFLTSW